MQSRPDKRVRPNSAARNDAEEGAPQAMAAGELRRRAREAIDRGDRRTALRPLLGRLGLMLIEDREELSLASSGDCSAVVERFLEVPQAEPLSPAAVQVLAIVAYEQPVTQADISRIRGVDSDGVVASLLTRGLITEEHRFALRGASVPLVTSKTFLRQFGLASLSELPYLAASETLSARQAVAHAG